MDHLKIPLSKIKLATNNFDEEYLIGSGGSGFVYKVQLDVLPKINKTVAIKRIFKGAEERFFTEIELLTCYKHPNIISLLGFSKEEGEMILVLEFASKGSLGDCFHSKTVNLSWQQRLQICLDIANGINYLHTNMEGKPCIIHRDIKSDNILLDENLNTKVIDFGFSKSHPMKQQVSSVYTERIAGTHFYMDPEYLIAGKYKRESDVYSFGVVLFEVLSGKMAYDSIYIDENNMGLAPIARRRFAEGTLKELIDPKLTEENFSDIFTLNRGLNQDSFNAFSKIAYQCLAETQAKRPTMEFVIKELQNALNLQVYKSAINNFSVSSATNNFSNENLITKGAFGKVYKGQFLRDGRLFYFTVRRFDYTYGQGDELQTEISMIKNLEHKNIISILEHYDENDERIIIYEQAFHGTLDQHISDPNLTWSKRLHICLGVARALNYIHYDVIHCDIHIALKYFWIEIGNPRYMVSNIPQNILKVGCIASASLAVVIPTN